MVLWNTGSIANHVGNYIGWNIVGNISGTVLNDIVIQEINFANTYTNENIGLTNISERYQPALIDLVISKVMFGTEMQQGGVDSVSLGELSISQAGGGGAELAKEMRNNAILRLKELGRSLRFVRVIGG
jgi:hypothetical protein